MRKADLPGHENLGRLTTPQNRTNRFLARTPTSGPLSILPLSTMGHRGAANAVSTCPTSTVTTSSTAGTGTEPAGRPAQGSSDVSASSVPTLTVTLDTTHTSA